MNEGDWIQFEDDYFETKEGKQVQENVNYIPVLCHHKWFFDQKVLDTAESLQNQANFCYWVKDYSNASSLYERVLNEFFSSSPFMKRNLLESIARCQFQLGDLKKAKHLAEECLMLSYTVELKSSILDLLICIYGSLYLWSMQKDAYLQLISYHPHNYRLWVNLSKCISMSSKSESEKKMLNNLLEAACLIRASMLIKTIKTQERASKLLMVEEKLNSLSLPDNFIFIGKDFYSKDLSEEHMSVEEPKDLSKLNEDNSKGEATNHETQWFKWVYSFLK